MGHDQHRADIVAQRRLQPGHALGVEVVGRLVEQQHLRLLEQQLAERDAAALAAREVGHRAVGRRAAQRVERDLDAAVDLPAIAGVDLLLQVGLLGQQLVHLLLGHLLAEGHGDLVEAVEPTLHVLEGEHDVLADGQVGLEMRLLRQVADAHALRRPGLAAELLVLPGHDAHQRRLAGAVRAEHADLHVRQEGQGDAFEDLAPARVGLGEVFHHVGVLVGGHAQVLTGGESSVLLAGARRRREQRPARASPVKITKGSRNWSGRRHRDESPSY